MILYGLIFLITSFSCSGMDLSFQTKAIAKQSKKPSLLASLDTHRSTRLSTYGGQILLAMEKRIAAKRTSFNKLSKLSNKLTQKELLHNSSIKVIEYSNANDSIMTASCDGVVKIWDIDGELIKTLTHPTQGFVDAQFNKTDRHILIAYTTHALLYDLQTDHVHHISILPNSYVTFNAEKSHIVVGQLSSGIIEIFCGYSAQPLFKITNNSPIDMCIETINNSYVATVSPENVLNIWFLGKFLEQEKLDLYQTMENDAEYRAAFKALIDDATSLDDTTTTSQPIKKSYTNLSLDLGAFQEAQIVYSIQLPEPPQSIFFTSDCNAIVIFFTKCFVIIDKASGKILNIIRKTPISYFTHPDYTLIAAESQTMTGKPTTDIINITTGVIEKTLPEFLDIQFSTTGHYLAIKGNGILRIIDLADNCMINLCINHANNYDVEFSKSDTAIIIDNKSIYDLRKLKYIDTSKIFDLTHNNQQLAYLDPYNPCCARLKYLFDIKAIIENLSTDNHIHIANILAGDKLSWKSLPIEVQLLLELA